MADTASTSSTGDGTQPAPAGKVVYKRYDPAAAKNRRISQLSSFSGTDSGHTNGSTSVSRVLGGAPSAASARGNGSAARPSSIVSTASYTGSERSAATTAAGTPSGYHSEDYFVPKHTDSTAPSLSTRARERDRVTSDTTGVGAIKPGNTLQKSSAEWSSSTSSAGSDGVPTPSSATSQPAQPALQSSDSGISLASITSGTSSVASVPSTVHPRPPSATKQIDGYARRTVSHNSPSSSRTGSPAPIPPTGGRPPETNTTPAPAQHIKRGSISSPSGPQFPRSQSAMASLGPPGSSSSSTTNGHAPYRPFIPPSAYVSNPNSAVSSPGVGSLGAAMGVNVANQISSAFSRGFQGVGAHAGTASNVANAVWSKLPPGLQASLNNGRLEGGDGSWSPQSVWGAAAGTGNHAAGSASPGSIAALQRASSSSVQQLPPNAVESPGRRPSHSGNGLSETEVHLQALATSPRPGSLGSQAGQSGFGGGSGFSLHSRDGSYTSTSMPAPALALAPVPRQKMPYKAGYQPKFGVWRNRTDEFSAFRASAKGGSSSIGRGLGSKEGDSIGLSKGQTLLEEERLLRRLEKIVEIHFPSPAANNVNVVQETQPRGGLPRSNSASSNLSTESGPPTPQRIASGFRRTSGLFRSAMRGVKGSGDTRSADQSIVKWQDDNEATRCPICYAPFNLITRKHHCRLCGRVVCFLPPNLPLGPPKATIKPNGTESETPPPLPSRSQRCSTFFLYEHFPASQLQNGYSGSSTGLSSLLSESEKGSQSGSLLSQGILREVDLGDHPSPALAALHIRERERIESEAELRRAEEVKRGVRVCRDCLTAVMKRQKKLQPRRVEGWLRLYGLLNDLQKEIEMALPLLNELKATSPVTAEVAKLFAASRKALLKNLTSYDLIAKRIRDLPAAPTTPTSLGPAPGTLLPSTSSQDRLQKAIYSRATLFLGEKMALIKSMGGLQPPATAKIKPRLSSHSSDVSTPSVSEGGGSESSFQAAERRRVQEQEDEEKMARLAVLYEQEALVSGYLDDANQRRQFEDAQALKASLDDLHKEIIALLE